jgi:hypothetical protein
VVVVADGHSRKARRHSVAVHLGLPCSRGVNYRDCCIPSWVACAMDEEEGVDNSVDTKDQSAIEYHRLALALGPSQAPPAGLQHEQ